MKPKYEIGQELETVSFGLGKVLDIFVSPTSGKYCYAFVAEADGSTYLCTEEELS